MPFSTEASKGLAVQVERKGGSIFIKKGIKVLVRHGISPTFRYLARQFIPFLTGGLFCPEEDFPPASCMCIKSQFWG